VVLEKRTPRASRFTLDCRRGAGDLVQVSTSSSLVHVGAESAFLMYTVVPHRRLPAVQVYLGVLPCSARGQHSAV